MKKNIIILLLFVFLSLVMTYPLVFKMKNHIAHDMGDPLLNTWILAWDIHKFKTGFSGFWDANIFYPAKMTLTFSENLIGEAIIGFPVMLMTNDIVFTYNFLILFAFILSGFGAYLLVKYLTKNDMAGVIGGIIYTFAPYHYVMLSHLQLVTIQWIPFSFLYLHKYFDSFKTRYLIYFLIFFVLQSLSCLYLCFFVGVFVIFHVVYYILNKKIRDIKILIRILISFIFIAITLVPVLYPYEKAKKLYGFQRTENDINLYCAHIESYVSIPYLNRIYKNLLYRTTFEDQLFIGFVAWILVIAGFWLKRNKNSEFILKQKKNIFLYVWYVLIGLNIFILIAYFFTHGESIHIFGKKVLNSCEDTKAFTNLLGLIVLRLTFDKTLRFRIKQYFNSIDTNKTFYLCLTLLAILLSFGLTVKLFNEKIIPGLYNVLYYLVPGFRGMRVTARMGIIFILGMSVLAGYGYTSVSCKLRKHYLGIILIFLMIVEYISVPIPVPEVRSGENIPPVYKWLASQKEDFAIVFLPPFSFPGAFFTEAINSYYSTYHWKKTVNGYSGYFPPIHTFIYRKMDNFPSNALMDILKNIGVKYIIIHTNDYTGPKLAKLNKDLEIYKDKLSFIGKYDFDAVYEVKNSSFNILQPGITEKRLFIPKDNWKAKSNYKNDEVELAFDNDMKTRWSTACPRNPGAYFQLDIGETYLFNNIQLKLAESYSDYPEKCKLEVSKDGKKWEIVDFKEDSLGKSLLPSIIFSPKEVKIDMTFTAREARYIKITQYGKDDYYDWSIFEIEVVKVK